MMLFADGMNSGAAATECVGDMYADAQLVESLFTLLF
jgi:hypothetical protein